MAGIAGSENHLLELLPRLRQYGFAPTMLVIQGPSDRPELFIERMRSSSIPTLVIKVFGDLDLRLLLRIRSLLKQFRFPIVHTHLVHADLYGLVANKLFGEALVVSSRHNDDPHWSKSRLAFLYRGIVRLADHYICISEYLKEWLQSTYRISVAQIDVVHYGLATDRPILDQDFRAKWDIPRNAPLLGMVARFCEQKGHDVLLRALPQVLNEFPEARLALVGFGELKSKLHSLVNELGLSQSVFFAGEVPNAYSIMSTFDIFVQPSRWEGFGLVFLEAMAAGVPIVATKVSAIPEIVIDGKTGLLVQSDQPEALAKAILELLRNPERAKVLGRAGAERVRETFSLDVMAKRTAEVYHNVLLHRPSQRSHDGSTNADQAVNA